jgi:hypothetical protein
MTDQQLIEKFNPATAGNLSPEDIEILRALTDPQIAVLAKAYPNQPRMTMYLRYSDNRVAADKQILQRGSWQNLHNARKYSNATYLRPYDFILPGNKQLTTRPAPGMKVAAAPARVQVDLTAQEAAEELRKNLTPAAGNVDNTNQPPPPPKPAKPAKAGKAATVKASKEVTEKAAGAGDGVENESLPDDQNFGDGE